jgi:hypothetical protein
VSIFLVTVYYYCYSLIGKSASGKKNIWVRPKPKPALPFGLGPAPEPLKLEEFRPSAETSLTLAEYETEMVKEQVQAMIFPIAIAYFMSLKFNVHVSLMMQAVMLPLNALDSGIIKKYIFGSKSGNGGYGDADAAVVLEWNGGEATLYGELLKAPTEDLLKRLNNAVGAVAKDSADAPALVDAAAAKPLAAGAARVEELPDEPKSPKKEETPEEIAARKASIAKKVEEERKKAKAKEEVDLD